MALPATDADPGPDLSAADFYGALEDARLRRNKRMAHLDALLRGAQLCLFGYGGKGRQLARHIAFECRKDVFIHDTNPATRARARADGFAVIDDFNGIDRSRVATILGACQVQLEQAALVGSNFIYYQEAAYLFDMPFLFDSSRAFTDELIPHQSDFYGTYRRLAGSSRTALLDVLRFRLSLDPHDIASSRRPNSDMWFDQIERHAAEPYRTILDLGAYDGDTLAAALQRLGVARGIAVEANSALFDKIEAVGARFPDGIAILPYAAWSHDCHLSFEEVRGGMMRVYEDKEGSLPAVALDSVVTEPVDLVKLDIEGSEIAALRGARRILSTYKPDLAIAGYHRPLDLVEIPGFFADVELSGERPVFHLAHYSDCFDDTILYCLQRCPRELS